MIRPVHNGNFSFAFYGSSNLYERNFIFVSLPQFDRLINKSKDRTHPHCALHFHQNLAIFSILAFLTRLCIEN